MKYLLMEGYLDKLQVSILTPFPGTPFYKWVKEKGYLLPVEFWQFDGENFAVVSYPNYSSSQIKKMKEKMLKERDRLILKMRIKKGEFLSWVKDRFHKYGFIGGVKKGVVRILKTL